jgi:hypothetical protein
VTSLENKLASQVKNESQKNSWLDSIIASKKVEQEDEMALDGFGGEECEQYCMPVTEKCMDFMDMDMLGGCPPPPPGCMAPMSMSFSAPPPCPPPGMAAP